MEQRYRSARTLQATFLERYSEDGRTVRLESGVAYFRRPGKMRWEYQSPEKNLFLIDGKSAWFYVPADHTVTRVPAKQSTDWRTPLSLLAGEMKVSRICAEVASVAQEPPENSGHVVFSCILRGEGKGARKSPASAPEAPSAPDSVFFEVVSETGELVRVLIRNRGGVTVEFHFAAWRMDPPVSEPLFRFTPPLGVAIVDGLAPNAQR
jgi:outer membrane lipoprotein carrier protein